ncbi:MULTISPECIES: tripartite tricarboxylate transporter substrate binding protein [unclassified Salipiger]|uniref:Bug family tripartite tricarboxylate transporter substrate binding protein n=1 Tax=unclassified Salipiger TaxID=2640570 RepID=UPI0013BB07A2|nr:MULTISPECIES: tripartite tricarboxylate transporter substrate binding protein [unclassified Salipiger]NDV48740.1 tripartite tricarboxylate transporter substrate binding protein [Salipiger sp. PrR003]NDW33634.1 tripartite tricarboxylate transporter substrate binding protein [Salipiger sp. PrR007]
MKKLLGSIALAVIAATGPAVAQDYPDQAVTLVVPYGPGGASDLAGRALAETAQPFLGQPVTVMNKPGAGGMNGARSVSEAEPDGYTLLLARVGMALSPAVTPGNAVEWDAYTFLGALEATPMILAVRGDAPYNSVEELVAAIKDSDGRMTYAASGATAIDGFTTQALLADNDLDPLTAATLVPYKGGGELATALLGGHVDFVAMAAASLMPHIKSGDMKALMVFAPKRMGDLPEVATAAELGYEKAGQIAGWSALYGPKNLPEDVVAKWHEVLGKVATDETWLDLAARRGSISTIGDVDMTDYAKSQYELFHGLAQDFGYLSN